MHFIIKVLNDKSVININNINSSNKSVANLLDVNVINSFIKEAFDFDSKTMYLLVIKANITPTTQAIMLDINSLILDIFIQK